MSGSHLVPQGGTRDTARQASAEVHGATASVLVHQALFEAFQVCFRRTPEDRVKNRAKRCILQGNVGSQGTLGLNIWRGNGVMLCCPTHVEFTGILVANVGFVGERID